MSFRVDTNITSMVARRHMANSQKNQDKELIRLASGDRIERSHYDPSGLAISEKMRAHIRSLGQAYRNTNDGISILQVAEGGLNSMGEMGARLKELALQSANGTLSDRERSLIDLEFGNLKTEIKRLAEATEFNGVKSLDGSQRIYGTQVGIHEDPLINRVSYRVGDILKAVDNLEVTNASVATTGDARDSLGAVDNLIHEVSRGRGYLGGVQNRLQITANSIGAVNEGMESSKSKIRDVDVAKSTSERIKMGIITNASMQVLSQANRIPEGVGRLLDS